MTKELQNIIDMTQSLHDAVQVKAKENLKDLRRPFIAYIGISDEINYILLTDGEDGDNAAKIVMKHYPGSTETYCDDPSIAAYLYTANATPDIEIRAYTAKKVTAGDYVAGAEIDHIIKITKDIRAAFVAFNKCWLAGKQGVGVICIDISAEKDSKSHMLLDVNKTAAAMILDLPGVTSEYIPDEWSNLHYHYSALAAPGVIVNAYTTDPVRTEK